MNIKIKVEVIKHLMVVICCCCCCCCMWAAAEANSGCQNQCGSINIPYPFGIGDGCNVSDPKFVITCNSIFNPPKAYLGKTKIQVLDVYVSYGQLRILRKVSTDCHRDGRARSFKLSKFYLSNTRNQFTVVGCDTWGVIGTELHRSGCASSCSQVTDVTDGSCNGIGCCHTDIPKMLNTYTILIVESLAYNSRKDDDVLNGCSYAFVVEDGAYNFSTSDLTNFSASKLMVPLILDWTIGNGSCSEAKKDTQNYACKENSICIDSKNAPGYLCNCTHGFRGNPYLPNGCQDINECIELNPCLHERNCVNSIGGYMCYCPDGYEGDGLKNGKGCIRRERINRRLRILIVIVVISSTLGLLCLILGVWWLCKVLRTRKKMKLKEKFFKRNGGLLLMKKSADQGGVEKTKLFTSKEIEDATDKFNENRILGAGGQGLVYLGMLHDGKIVAVKKSKIVNEALLEQFINEIVILSQIDHRNIVKLLGCCLETEVPLLVFEFVSRRTLYHLIHDTSGEYPRSWEIRLRIATEVASAISYLHSAASVPIYHRDIKSFNILLDEKLRAKIADFGASISIDIDQTHLTTQVKGTFGYIDPEYFRSNQFTEKSDVYSFGVVLIELLTGRKPISPFGSNENKSLVANFISCLEENHLADIVDVQVMKECENEELMAIACLAKRCLSLDGRSRPTMKEVAIELEIIRMSTTTSHHCTSQADQPRLEDEIDETTTESDDPSDLPSTSTR